MALKEILPRLGLAGEAAEPRQVLEMVRPEHTVLDGFRPLSECLEARLSSAHWDEHGILPFVENDVPYLINNSGRLSEDAASLLFVEIREAQVEGPILVLEIGAGTGLFCRYFLDTFRAICVQENADFYDRLLYIVTDRSPRTCRQWVERGLFDEHAGRVRIGCGDGAGLVFAGLEGEPVAIGRCNAVFANYVLDVLPATIVRRCGENGSFEELRIRTHLAAQPDVLHGCAGLTLDEIRSTVGGGRNLARLAPVAGMFEHEVAWFPLEDTECPVRHALLQAAHPGDRILINDGAARFLQAAAAHLGPRGFILINDYGPIQPEQVPLHSASQRFGPTIAAGVNFPLLECFIRSQTGLEVLAGDGDEGRMIHSRLITAGLTPETAKSFQSRFSASAAEYFEAPLTAARSHSAAGRKDAAVDAYREAVERSPREWSLIAEVADYVGLQLQDHESGLKLARAAVELNPWYSAWVWNILGDCLYCLGRRAEAHEAFSQAERIDPNDERTNLNLAYTYAEAGDHRRALDCIARGLANPRRETYRERLLAKQQEILNAISLRRKMEGERLQHRTARFFA
jgi:tetratricopeptide (TPR) repeat protein